MTDIQNPGMMEGSCVKNDITTNELSVVFCVCVALTVCRQFQHRGQLRSAAERKREREREREILHMIAPHVTFLHISDQPL